MEERRYVNEEESQVILEIAEYRELENKIKELTIEADTKRNINNRQNDEIAKLELNIETLKKENIKLKKGIISYVKMLGETND